MYFTKLSFVITQNTEEVAEIRASIRHYKETTVRVKTCSSEQGQITQWSMEAKGMNEETDLPITPEIKGRNRNRTQTSKLQNDTSNLSLADLHIPFPSAQVIS